QTRKGRSSSPEEDKESALWEQWRDAGMISPDSAEGLDVMMLMAEEQNVNLTSVWTQVKVWSRKNAAGTEVA
ncbi:DUF2857 family protein, partial [Salmonella enterica]|nr:DUF2857 family protein [Salmonella enterica]EBP7651674.1 DUF2857 family protein [Salmonella enterica]